MRFASGEDAWTLAKNLSYAARAGRASESAVRVCRRVAVIILREVKE
jgi:hypothetical protein